MRKMKKILAWLTVLTVNVSMMPMPTVAAATATDASTALNEETITSDATKEATQAQETAKKAVESATKAAAMPCRRSWTTTQAVFPHIISSTASSLPWQRKR